jgi:hypothetical protein
MFDLRQNVIYAHRTLMRAKARDRRSVIQSRHGCSKPTKGRIFVTKYFRCPGNGLRQFLRFGFENRRFRLSAGKQTCRNDEIFGCEPHFIVTSNDPARTL